MTSVRIEQITRRFGQQSALDGVDLSINAGELFFLLGPSGCGKSTLLRLIAGLDQPTAGRIFFGDRDVTALPTGSRSAVMCFQSYALWPHLSVRENVRFGLDVRRVNRAEQDRRVTEVLTLVQMESLGDRKPNQLSGGQQQRVALARALAVQPECLLLDEPLSNLDANLRLEMRGEIRRICKTAGFTTIYVTHDQKEALSVADRIAIMRAGRIAQVGTPSELYGSPCSGFVAEFMGQTNLFPGRVVSQDIDGVSIDTPIGRLVAPADGTLPEKIFVSIRPEHIRVRNTSSAAPGGSRLNCVAARSVETIFLGESSEHLFAVDGQRLKALRTPPLKNLPSEVSIEFDRDDVVVLKE